MGEGLSVWASQPVREIEGIDTRWRERKRERFERRYIIRVPNDDIVVS